LRKDARLQIAIRKVELDYIAAAARASGTTTSSLAMEWIRPHLERLLPKKKKERARAARGGV
jgi:hypothetical protein